MRISLVALALVTLSLGSVGCKEPPTSLPPAAEVKVDVTTTAVATPAATDAVAEGKDEGGCGAHVDHAEAATLQAAFDGVPAHGTEALCLVMNRKFVVDEKTVTSVHNGKTYAFCCDGCKQVFDENPTKFVTASAAPVGTATSPDAKPGT